MTLAVRRSPQEPGAWWLWIKYSKSPADSKKLFIYCYCQSRQSWGLHTKIHYKRDVHYHIFQELLMSNRRQSPCTTLMSSKADEAWPAMSYPVWGEKCRAANWPRDAESLTSRLLVTISCAISTGDICALPDHTLACLYFSVEVWKCQNALGKTWALFALSKEPYLNSALKMTAVLKVKEHASFLLHVG